MMQAEPNHRHEMMLMRAEPNHRHEMVLMRAGPSSGSATKSFTLRP